MCEGEASVQKAALNAFKAATSRELRTLCTHGYSRKAAIGLLLSRICHTEASPITDEQLESPDVLALSREASMSPEEALRAIVVQQQVKKLRGEGHDLASALDTLTAALLNSQTSLATDDSAHQFQPDVKVAADPPSSPLSVNSVTSELSVASPTKPVPAPNNKRAAGKRPRRSTDQKESADSEADKKEAVRQMQHLTTEINEAMRSGDRAKVALLMRQRDQIRSTGIKRQRSTSTPAATEPKAAAAEESATGKRPRHPPQNNCT